MLLEVDEEDGHLEWNVMPEYVLLIRSDEQEAHCAGLRFVLTACICFVIAYAVREQPTLALDYYQNSLLILIPIRCADA